MASGAGSPEPPSPSEEGPHGLIPRGVSALFELIAAESAAGAVPGGWSGRAAALLQTQYRRVRASRAVALRRVRLPALCAARLASAAWRRSRAACRRTRGRALCRRQRRWLPRRRRRWPLRRRRWTRRLTRRLTLLLPLAPLARLHQTHRASTTRF